MVLYHILDKLKILHINVGIHLHFLLMLTTILHLSKEQLIPFPKPWNSWHLTILQMNMNCNQTVIFSARKWQEHLLIWNIFLIFIEHMDDDSKSNVKSNGRIFLPSIEVFRNLEYWFTYFIKVALLYFRTIL